MKTNILFLNILQKKRLIKRSNFGTSKMYETHKLPTIGSKFCGRVESSCPRQLMRLLSMQLHSSGTELKSERKEQMTDMRKTKHLQRVTMIK